MALITREQLINKLESIDETNVFGWEDIEKKLTPEELEKLDACDLDLTSETDTDIADLILEHGWIMYDLVDAFDPSGVCSVFNFLEGDPKIFRGLKFAALLDWHDWRDEDDD